MMKTKQHIPKQKNPTSRKPSLPIRRNSSTHSHASDQSCLSDRILYRKNASMIEQSSLRNLDGKQQQKKHDRLQEPDKDKEKSLKKMKSKINISTNETTKRSEPGLTGFQWLIIMRHCFHIENKRRSANSIKQRTLTNYIKNKMYPDSLWNKILVSDNERKLTAHEVVATIERQNKWKLTLDDILVCISKNFSYSDQSVEEHESAAETARFTENMKPNIEKPAPTQASQQNYYSQPKFIYKNPQKQKNRQIDSNLKKQKPRDKPQIPAPAPAVPPAPAGRTTPQAVPEQQVPKLQPMNITSINSFQLDQGQLGLNISPISIIDQTNNDISFSLEDSQHPSQYQSQSQSQSQFSQSRSRSVSQSQSQSQSYSQYSDFVDRFEEGFSGIQELKRNLQLGNSSYEGKVEAISFLEQILGYSIYKNKQGRPSINDQKNPSFKKPLSPSQTLDCTQYLYSLKLQSRQNLSKLTPQILQRLFTSPQFTQYFHSLHAIKITQYYSQLSYPLKLLGPSLIILNLSNNNIRSISALKDQVNIGAGGTGGSYNLRFLRFVNFNFNFIRNMGELLGFQVLEEVHVKANQIDHVHSSKDKVIAKRLKIIDLANNHIQKEQDLWALNYLPNLTMLNLSGNPILSLGFKSLGVIPKEIITDHCQMYIFSAFIQYKDVAFSTSRKRESREIDKSKEKESPMSSTSPNLCQGQDRIEKQDDCQLRLQYHSHSQTQLQGGYRRV